MFVDFSNLTRSQLDLFNSKSTEALQIYNRISSELLDESPNDISWLTNNATSRDTSWSRVLYYINCIVFLEALNNKDGIDEIKIDNPIFAKILKCRYDVICDESLIVYRAKAAIKNIYHYFFNVWRCIHCLCAKSNQRLYNIIRLKNVTLIDTFIAKRMDSYEDRYYDNVVESNLNGNFCYLINYLPTPHRSDTKSITNNTVVPVLFYFDLLKLSDYLFGLKRIIFGKRKVSHSYIVNGIDITDILNECSLNSTGFYYLRSLLYYRMAKRIFTYNIDLRLLIDWYENQGYDRSLYYSFYEQKKEKLIRGFMGHIPDIGSWPHRIATPEEYAHNIAPKYLFVCSKFLYDVYITNQYPGVLFLAPLYRAQKVWHIDRIWGTNSVLTVLAPLGIGDYETKTKLSFIVEFIREKKINNIRFVIKPHPNFPLKRIHEIINKVDFIEIVQGDIYDYLPYSDVIIGANTTVMYEALAIGIPVLNILDPKGIIQLSRPQRTPDVLWYDINDSIDMANSLEIIKNQDVSKLISCGKIIKEYFFEIKTDEKTSNLFGC